MFYSFGICSVSHLSLIAVVKCCVIVRPFNYFNTFTDRTIQGTVACVWISSFVLGFLPAMCGGQYQLKWTTILPSSVPGTKEVNLIGGLISVFAFVVCTCVAGVCYTTIFLIVRKHLRSIHVAPASIPNSNVTTRPAHVTEFARSVRSSRNLFVITASYLFTYVPLIIMIFVQLSGKVTLSATASMASEAFTTWFYVCASFTNALLYVVLHRSVRRELKSVFARMFPKDTNTNSF